MGMGCIYNVDLTTNNQETISVSSDNFKNFYIANIDQDGDEIEYSKNEDSKTLFANFFMIKVLKNSDIKSDILINHLLTHQEIIKVSVYFTNGNRQEFDLPKKRIVNNGKMVNAYEEAFLDENDLCIIVTDQQLKYKKNLFV